MSNKWIVSFSALLLSSWAAWPSTDVAPDAKSVIDAASKALGSTDLKTIEYSGSGADFALGQAPNPSSPWPRFNDKTYTRSIDFDALTSRVQRVRTQGENPPRGGGGQPVVGEQKQNLVITPGSPQAGTLRDELTLALPFSFLKSAAASSDATVKSQKVAGKRYTVFSFPPANKARVSGYLNNQNLLEKIEGRIDNNVLGDIPVEAAFSDYKDFNGLKFPTHILQKQGGYPVLDLTVSDVKANAPVDIGTPQGGGAAPAAIGPATSEKLGEGVYLIRGGYAVLAVGFKDYTVVIEGPQNDQRAKAIITEVKSVLPNKPIRYVVNTHAHFDHAGGLRAFVAEGAIIITQQINKSYYEKIWANPHTLNPDELAKNPRKAHFKTVSEKLVLSDGEQVVELHHLQNFGHNDGTLVAYLPKEKILVEADAFTPPAQPLTQTPAAINPFTASLVDNIARLKLDVETIIPIHYPVDNRKVTEAELLTAAGKPNLSAHAKAEPQTRTRRGNS